MRQNESMLLTRARHVTEPTMPSAVIPTACWKPRTAELDETIGKLESWTPPES
jgi:hypothetical protein